MPPVCSLIFCEEGAICSSHTLSRLSSDAVSCRNEVLSRSRRPAVSFICSSSFPQLGKISIFDRLYTGFLADRRCCRSNPFRFLARLVEQVFQLANGLLDARQIGSCELKRRSMESTAAC